MPGKGFKITPSELHSGANSLGKFSDRISGLLGKLRNTHQKLKLSGKSDKSGVGQIVTKTATTSDQVMGDVAQEGVRVTKGASTRLHAGATAHSDNEEVQTGTFKSITDKGEEGTTKPSSAGGGGSEGDKGGKQPEGDKPGGNDKPNGDDKPSGDKPSGSDTPPGDKPAGDTPGGNDGDGGNDKGKQPEGDGGGGGDGPSTEPQSDENAPRPALRPDKKPPSASDQPSDQFTNDPKLPEPKNYSEPLPNANSDITKPPPDKTRGAKVEQIDESRVTRKNGLIDTVDGKPVKQYIQEQSQQRAHGLSHDANGNVATKPKKAGEGRCSALAVDLKTGLVTQGVNGKNTDVIPNDKLHPLLQQNLQDMRAYKHPVQGFTDPKGNSVVHDGQAHYSSPAGHAEVKATNELLWQRQSQLPDGETLPPSTLNEMRIDPRWTQPTGSAPIGDAAPACANCNSILDGVGSYTGRCTYDPHDDRYTNPAIPPVEE